MRLQSRQSHLRKNAVILLAIVVLVLLGGIVCAVFFLHGSTPKNQQIAKPTEAKKAPTRSVAMSAMGDMIAHDTITTNARTENGYDYTRYFQKIRPLYESSDIVFCNQESLSSGEQFGLSGYPAFNAPTSYAADLQKIGCNVINLANNHMGDKGTAATDATVATWQKLEPLAYAGANRTDQEQGQVRYFEKNGIKFAFLAFMDFNNNPTTSGYSVNSYHDERLFKQLVTEARAHADVVMVSMHWGAEDSHDITPDQRAAVDNLASYGADVVIGTGPHVLQPVEYVTRPDGKQMLVWYSIGNMLTSQLKLDELLGGVASWSISKTDTGVSIQNPVFKPTFMSYEWTAEQEAAQDTDARTNPMIYPLDDAAVALERMRMNTTVAQAKAMVSQYLGPTARLK